jgi:hypothetical protein
MGNAICFVMRNLARLELSYSVILAGFIKWMYMICFRRVM